MSTTEEVGRIINGRYEIVRVIGEGGMGVVYEAYDTQVDRNVAIKLVREECLTDRKFVSRFRRELEVTTQLRHPSTIRVFEHGATEDGRPFMVMELLVGESLADRMEKERIPEVEALQYARQVAESLSEAHEHGIFHRDLKPDNIFIETVGVSTVVKVLDFGIAGGLDATRLTRAGEVFGTPQYMSPEQCNGHTLDHRTDIYSLGCILYEMLEGRPPFSGENPMATMLKHVKSKVPTPKYACAETAKVLSMALRKDRSKRVQSCGRLAELLGECIGAARAVKEGRYTDRHSKSGPRKISESSGVITATTSSLASADSIAADSSEDRSKFILGGLALGLVILLAIVMFGNFGTSDRGDSGTADSDALRTSGVDPATSSETLPLEKLPKNRASINASVPDVTVIVDGILRCETPCTIQIPVGDGQAHRIVLRKAGYIDVEKTWQPKSVVENPPEFAAMTKSQG